MFDRVLRLMSGFLFDLCYLSFVLCAKFVGCTLLGSFAIPEVVCNFLFVKTGIFIWAHLDWRVDFV
jgi:hypothetical protein